MPSEDKNHKQSDGFKGKCPAQKKDWAQHEGKKDEKGRNDEGNPRELQVCGMPKGEKCLSEHTSLKSRQKKRKGKRGGPKSCRGNRERRSKMSPAA